MEIYNKAEFLTWDELDEKLSEWGAEYLNGYYAYAEAERDGQSMYVALRKLDDCDEQKFIDLVKGSDEIADPQEAWESIRTEEYRPILPEDISMEIMGGILGLKVSVECATEDGVYFFHSNPEPDQHVPVVESSEG